MPKRAECKYEFCAKLRSAKIPADKLTEHHPSRIKMKVTLGIGQCGILTVTAQTVGVNISKYLKVSAYANTILVYS